MGTADELLERASTDPLGALIIDVGLPGGDGRDLCQALRAQGLLAPVLLLTTRGGRRPTRTRRYGSPMKYVLLYRTGDLAKAQEHFPEHRARFERYHADGTLLMLGPYADPAEGAMSIFTTREAAEEFARGDPFVLNGVISSWDVREWNEALVP